MKNPICPYCAEGIPLIKLQRQYIHRIGYRNYVCTEAGFQTEANTWNGYSPKEWVPRRLRIKK